MPPKKLPLLWTAPPHTIAKIAILEGYLQAWFPMLGRIATPSQNLLYIDGFAGPGRYINHPTGSPIAALRVASKALAGAGHQWRAGDIHCAFFEADEARFAHLKQHVEPFEGVPRLHIHTYRTTFAEGLSRLRAAMPHSFSGSSPLFVFVDPFGPTGVSFSAVADILSSPRSEVLINFDVDAIGRIFRAGEYAAHERLLTDIFGDDSWLSTLGNGGSDFSGLCREVLRLYKGRIRSLSAVQYVFSFEMKNSTDSLEYDLVFASQHPRGLEKMKEAMRRIDQTGEFRFSDAHVGRQMLFRFDHPQDFAPKLHNAFIGREVRYADVVKFVLNETPFPNPKSILRLLDREGMISVVSNNPNRRLGTFKDGSIISIRFKKEDSDGEAEQH